LELLTVLLSVLAKPTAIDLCCALGVQDHHFSLIMSFVHRHKVIRQYEYCGVVVVWLSDNALVSINEVILRRARLVLGWVTVCERVNHLGM